MKKRNLYWALAAVVSVGMGMTMPSCPGQQALQQSVDAVQATTNDHAKKLTSQQAQVNLVNSEVGKLKEVVAQMNTTIEAQKGSIKQLEDAMKSLQAAPPAKAAGAKAPARRRR